MSATNAQCSTDYATSSDEKIFALNLLRMCACLHAEEGKNSAAVI